MGNEILRVHLYASLVMNDLVDIPFDPTTDSLLPSYRFILQENRYRTKKRQEKEKLDMNMFTLKNWTMLWLFFRQFFLTRLFSKHSANLQLVLSSNTINTICIIYNIQY